MANFNKVMLIGRLTRDVETKAFSNGGMVAKFGFAVTNRKKNAQTGQWDEVPMYIDCEVFNRGENGKLADLVRDRCRKGSQIMVEGRLELDTWQDKTTQQNRTKHKIVVDTIQLLDPRQQDGGGNMGENASAGTNGAMSRGPAPRTPNKGYSANVDENDFPNPDDDHEGGGGKGGGSDIPF